MSDSIQHECGIALIRLLKPLEYYREKYGSAFYGIHKMYLMLEKQHNRGQDGAGFASIKLDMQPGERYISRIRSNQSQPIQDIFAQINSQMQQTIAQNPECMENVALQKKHLPYLGELFLGHLRYGTYGKNSLENVHPFLRENSWMHRNLIIAGNFNMTNVGNLFNELVKLGQHPKEKSDTVTVMERIGYFLDQAVEADYRELKGKGYSKMEASSLIANRLNIAAILKKAASDWDGGYVIAGLLGHGDAFVMRDPFGIRPAYYYKDEEVIVVASERPAIQTVFHVDAEVVNPITPGHALILKKNAEVSLTEILPPSKTASCSFERIYFSRGNDTEIYEERKKLGKLLLPAVLKAVRGDLDNTVFSYIPNTAETAFLGMVKAAQDHLNYQKEVEILEEGARLTQEKLRRILAARPRIEKVAIKDAKLRTFITEDRNREDLVAHVYDITYGSVKPTDSLVIIDDSIVRGTTLKKSILTMLDRLQPEKIVVVSSAPQIRYPDCYGIDMARLEDLIAFRAALALHHEQNTYGVIEEIYRKCKAQEGLDDEKVVNVVKEVYRPFTAEQLSEKIAELLKPEQMKAEVTIVFQTIENLHEACPNHTGDWYFTGNYPTSGGNRVANHAFINFYEGSRERPY